MTIILLGHCHVPQSDIIQPYLKGKTTVPGLCSVRGKMKVLHSYRSTLWTMNSFKTDKLTLSNTEPSGMVTLIQKCWPVSHLLTVYASNISWYNTGHSINPTHVEEYSWKSPKYRWWASHLLKNLELKTLLIKVRLWFKRQTWISPSWMSLNFGPPPELHRWGLWGRCAPPFPIANAMAVLIAKASDRRFTVYVQLKNMYKRQHMHAT